MALVLFFATYLMRTQAFLAMVYRFIRRSSSVDLPLQAVCTGAPVWRGGDGRGRMHRGEGGG